MRSFEHAYNVLIRVVDEGLPFNLAIKSSLKKENKKIDADFKSEVSASSGCVLRHYYVFKEVFLRKYPEGNEHQFLLVALGIANRLFSKRFNEEELNAYIAKESGLEETTEFIQSFNDPKALVPEDIPYGSKKFISLRYNLPPYIVKMWEKNAGPFLSKKLFKSLSNHQSTLLRINTQDITKEEFYTKYSEFTPFEDDNFACYSGKQGLKKHPAVINNDAFLIPSGYSFMLKDLDIDSIRGIAIYGGSTNSLLEELFLKLGSSFKADYLCGTQKHFFEAKETTKRLGLNSVALYECGYKGIVTCISKPVHTFFLCPENSYFLGLLERPDYFLTCKQEELDGFINAEFESLIETSDHVEDGGDLIYFVPTFCKNECRGVIRRFLEQHPEFTLIEEKQLFPFDKYQTLLYFAILRKEVKNG